MNSEIAATAIVQVGVYAGGCLGPVGFGLLATHASFAAAWIVAAVAMLIAGGGVLVGRRMLVRHRDAAAGARSDEPRAADPVVHH